MIEIIVNGARCTVESDTDTPLLWVLRDELGLTGTRFGCGAGLCGRCAVRRHISLAGHDAKLSWKRLVRRAGIHGNLADRAKTRSEWRRWSVAHSIFGA